MLRPPPPPAACVPWQWLHARPLAAARLPGYSGLGGRPPLAAIPGAVRHP